MTDDLPPLITDPARYHEGYLYVHDWEDYQHRDAIRTGPPMRWHKCLTEQLDSDKYRALTLAERGLVHDLRMLVSRTGQGAVMYAPRTLGERIGFVSSRLHVHLERVIQAGFVEVRAGKLPAACQQPASTEESREESAPTAHTPPRRKRARAGVAEGSPATNGKTLIAGIELDTETIRAMRSGYEPGGLTDQQIAAIQAELTEEPL